MELWEFNDYVKGYKEVYYNEQMNLMTLAYNTGMFSHETKHKPKPLEYYLKQIDRKFHKKEYNKVPVDVKKSKEIEQKIKELKEHERRGKS